MDRRSLIQCFRNAIWLASLAYIFTTLHTIQYSMQGHTDNGSYKTTAQNPQDDNTITRNPPDNASPTSSSMHNILATASTVESEKTSGCWTMDEIHLLLDYVKANCVLTTVRGLNLKKVHFNKARDTVKSKDTGQCHYKWGHVNVFIINKVFDY